MTTIVCTYYNRLAQLKRTLDSINQSAYNDFKVIIIDDASTEEITGIGDYKFQVDIYRVVEKISHNPAPLYNIGFKYALDEGADVIIIQNAECYHVGDIVSHASQIKPNEYYTYHCYSLSKDQEIGAERRDLLPLESGDEGWYNHEVVRPTMFHFCAAITADNLRKLNGFDERFAEGICYDDDYFVHQIKNLKLDVKFIADPFVYHQWHSVEPRNPVLTAQNEQLWTSLKGNNEYRAKHTITPDL
jgi:glycosyltransferase involved in cell wall biosynthesis